MRLFKPAILLSLIFCLGCSGGILLDSRGISYLRDTQIASLYNTETVDPPTPNNDDSDSSDAKINSREFRCLFIEDKSEAARRNLNANQLAMLNGKPVRDFLREHCVKGSDGKTPEFRFTIDGENLTGIWAELRDKYKPTEFPYVILSNGSASWGGKVTGDWNQLKEKFDHYAGVK